MNEVTLIEREASRTLVEDAYASRRFLYLDIETIPTQDEKTIAEIREAVKPPANIKKQESIDAWMKENADSAASDAVAKTSFDGSVGHICTISWALNGGTIKTEHARALEEEPEILSRFFADFDPYHDLTIVGHYVSGFDLPFIKKRAVILGVKLPPPNVFPRDPKPWGNGIHDTMVMWAGSKDTIGMDRLCLALGVSGKDGMDGSKVAEAWSKGEHDSIAQYCADDVERTRQIHQRFLSVGW